MQEHTGYLPGLSPIAGKQIHAAFDGGMLSSNAGVLLLREVERRLGIADRLAACLLDRRDPARIDHTVTEMIGFRAMAIAAGYEDADDCDSLRCEPMFKMAVGRLPESGEPLCSQPTMSRLENAVSRVALVRMMAAMVDLFCDSWKQVPARVELDIDDTEDAVHGCQQLALFNAYYDSHCFLPIHIYEATSGKPVAAILRPGKTPSGTEVRTILKHVIRRIRQNWPKVEILVRGDSHYGRPEALDWCEDNGIGYVFGLSGNEVLRAMVVPIAEDVAVRRVTHHASDAKVRGYGELIYAARSWRQERRVIARVEASDQGCDSRFVVTNLGGKAKALYERVYCARGQMENLIKAHKTHLASDRTSCHDAKANQFRLILHSAAYWLMHGLRAAAPKRSSWRVAQFDTLRTRLIKVAVRVVERGTRIKLALPTACPDKPIITHLARAFAAQAP
jgi:hypothetical protein